MSYSGLETGKGSLACAVTALLLHAILNGFRARHNILLRRELSGSMSGDQKLD